MAYKYPHQKKMKYAYAKAPGIRQERQIRKAEPHLSAARISVAKKKRSY